MPRKHAVLKCGGTIFVTSKILDKNGNFGQQSNFLSKIQFLHKNRNFGQNSRFWSEFEILEEIENVGQQSKFW